MPWKHLNNSPLHLPSRQDLLIIAGAVVICLLIIAFFIWRS
ncbi:membrane protein [Desulfosporosinus acididurans]|nr:membrane protein [Desulfosporosinus acididurans]